jgi:hypothetical protein
VEIIINRRGTMSIANIVIKEFEQAENLREFVQASDSESAYREELLHSAGGFSEGISNRDEKRLEQAARDDEVAKARDAAFERLNLTQDEVERESERQHDESA